MPSKPMLKDRAWGTRYDTLGTSPPPSPPAQRSITENAHSTIASTLAHDASISDHAAADSAPTKTHVAESIPHDASIFVGSLPANVDHGELTQQLSDHLTSYPQIKGVKVVRDSRGGVCAFVHCGSPSSAGDLLQVLQAHPPRPFMGRFLRFEPAKAFRTLLISYRIPTGFLSSSPDDITGNLDVCVTKPRLAHAMRIFRPRNTKHLGIIYDTDAMNFKNDSAAEKEDNPGEDVFRGNGFLLNPLKYDADTMRTLAAAFGPLESFSEYTDPEVQIAVRPQHLQPHGGPRCGEMEKGVWEIKWKDREDSVVALLTLRRVPHLSVSWAHHLPSTPIGGTHKSVPHFASGGWGSPVGKGSFVDGRESRRPLAQTIGQTPLLLPSPLSGATTSESSSEHPVATASHVSSPNLPRVYPANRTAYSTSSTWADQVSESELHSSESIISTSSSSLQTSTPVLEPVRSSVLSPPFDDLLPSPGFGTRHEFTPRSHQTRPFTPHNTPSVANAAGLYVSPLSARAKIDGTTAAAAENLGQKHFSEPSPQLSYNRGVEFDPTTVFVGGLDMSTATTWDEGRIREIFGRFGPIEDIHIVRPLNKRSAFAFVRFTNAASATRAMQEEHNRLHDGRPIRVQLRDRNPNSRGTWRSGRGRGRPLFNDPAHGYNDHFGGAMINPHTNNLLTANAPFTGIIGSSSLYSRSQAGQGNIISPGSGLNDSVSAVRTWQDRVDASMSSVSSSTTKVPSVHCEGVPSTTASPTPPPSTTSVSTSASAMPFGSYPVNVGFFAPPPWVHAYPSYPYPVPVVSGYTYPGYPYPSAVHSVPQPLVSGESPVSSTNSATNLAWSQNNNASKASQQTVDGVNVASPNSTAHQSTQPPLRATGFIQNEHGALIPVYQRDALDQYMANAHVRSGPESQEKEPSHPPAGPAAVPQSSTWPQPPPFAVFPSTYLPNFAPMASNPTIQPPNQRFWMHGPVPYGTPAYAQPGSNHGGNLGLPAGAAPQTGRKS